MSPPLQEDEPVGNDTTVVDNNDAAVDGESRRPPPPSLPSIGVVDLPFNERYDPSRDFVKAKQKSSASLRQQLHEREKKDGGGDDDLDDNGPDNDTDEGETVLTYVDYVPLPPAPVPPPSKYKLWLLVMVLVYFGVWFSSEAHVVPALTFGGYLGPHAALFLLMNIMVFVFTYAALDLLVLALTVKLPGGRSYGLVPWLKQPRVRWVYELRPSVGDGVAGVLMDVLAWIVTTFEDGFEIFNPTDAPKRDGDGGTGRSGKTEGGSHHNGSEFECSGEGEETCCQVMLKIQHSIKPGYYKEYDAWSDKIGRRAAAQPGFVRSVRERTNNEQKQDCRHTIYLTFANIYALNDWMTSPTRRALVDELEPMLASSDGVKLVQLRELPDAFTDLLTRQGEFVPVRLPKKWKVACLTACALFFSALILERVLPYYYERWGVSNSHERFVQFLDAIFGTWLVSFVMQPLLIMQFSEWLRRKPDEAPSTTQTPPPPTEHKQQKERQVQPWIWTFLNDGTKNVWIKLFITVAFFGGCGAKWAVLSYYNRGDEEQKEKTGG